MNAIDQLKSVLCNTMGKCCIAGSDEDRAIVDLALQSLSESAPVQMPVTWNQVQVCTWIGNQLMTQPSMFERNAVCKFVRSLGRNEKLAKYFPAPMAAQPRKAAKLSDDEIQDAINSTIGIGYRHLDEFARAIEAAVWAKLGVEP